MRGYREQYFIDSNIFLRCVLRDNIRMYESCAAFLRSTQRQRIYTSYLVIAEVYWVLLKVYKMPKESVLKFLNAIASLSNLVYTDDFSLMIALELMENHSVKFVDCLIASNKYIQARKMLIVSYDQDFDKLGVKRVEPEKLVKAK